ncbi:MAG: energy transducer TonB [Gemmatimonadaceae bacterium]
MSPRTPWARPDARVWALMAALAAVLAALVLVFAGGGSPSRPVMLNQEPPFRYPVSLYAKKIQGNVTLRIFVDSDGRVRPESTRVAESSGYTSFDSAAVAGSQELHFAPARQQGEPVAVSILFPVFFRHPEASPLPEDTVLKRDR